MRPSGALEDLPEAELLADLDTALRSNHPLNLLTMASQLMAVLDRRHRHSMAADDDELPSLARLCETLLNVGFRQTDALLLVFGRMCGNELLAKRIQRAVAERKHPMPGWLLRLDELHPTRVVEMSHVLRDGDNVALEVQLPGSRQCTVLIYIDHNLGTVVKDAFVLDGPLDELVENMANIDSASDVEVRELPLADARTRITDAIDTGAITFPPFETDTWPGIRPFTEWVVSMLPEGGTGYVRPEWSEKQLADLTNDFFASGFAGGLDDEDHRSLLGSILWFATDYGPGDPLRWSPTAVEILLLDWIPRKIVAPPDYLKQAPDLVRAFVRYCHAKRGIPRELTTQTLREIDDDEPAYQQAITEPHRHGAEALLERIGALGPLGLGDLGDLDDPELDLDDDAGYEQHVLDALASMVGGADALDRLNADPLPDEPFSWEGITDDIRDRVSEVSELADGCCAALFDVELRTAARRLLAKVAATDPQIFRRRSSPATAAAAVCWIVAKANDRLDLYQSGGTRVKDLMAHFRLTGTPSRRAEVMLRAIGVGYSYYGIELGDADLLVAKQRADVIAHRDRLRSTLG
jgi:hypothetical protein